ncbi:MAG: DNA topoisomerase IV subunit A [Spirochaetia bacterium]
MAYVNTLFNKNFLEYASYVIKDRAIPHLDDGLKPVQRRILHSLFEVDDGKFHKVANIVGHCMKYHPHGDASIYSALVVLANKEILIDKQGNFGNIYTGDQASAARYIECRSLPFAKEVLYNPEITQYEDSYDGRNREPVTFRAKLPLVLVIGAEGIAVGMSTKILPHNLKEVISAVQSELKGNSYKLYPDFPTGGQIDVSDYQDGLGKVLVRAKLDTSDPKRIVIREIPYGTTTESLITSIENAVRKNKIKVSSINDYTTENVEIELKLARGVHTNDVIDALYAFTDCEVSISVNCLVINNNTPEVMKITDIVKHHAKRLKKILKEELELEKGKLLDRLHMRTLEQIFVEERIYKEIEEKRTQNTVLKAVKDGFKPFKDQLDRPVTTEDVERLLKIPIRRISLYDINKAKKEMKEIRDRLKEIAKHLKNITAYAIDYLGDLRKEYTKDVTRQTEVKSFDKIDVREAAQRNLRLRYDSKTGYLGTEISSGNVLFDVSQYDRILVIRKDATYYVTDVPEKLFVGKGMRFAGLADKEELSKEIFSALYMQKDTSNLYIKRTKIEKYILEKTYSLIPDDGELIDMTTENAGYIEVEYVKKPRMKKIKEKFLLRDFLVKGIKANGVRLSTKEVKEAKFLPPRR